MRDVQEKVRVAVEAYESGCNCAQSVMSAYADEIGIPKDIALATIEGFGGGIGGRQEECGAVLAAVCAVSALLNQRPGIERPEMLAAVRDMCNRFASELGSTRCIDLLGGGKPFKHCCPDKVECAVRSAEAAIAAAGGNGTAGT
jgi:C_GCAxxG_C_C family probable redox protein